VLYDFTRQDASGAACTARAWAKVPERLSPAQREAALARAAELLQARDAVLVAHYYVDGDLQDLALATGGIVADSLEMARFGRDHAGQTLVVAGVRFMGETAKILSPHKRVLMPDLDATCSLDLGCPADEFAAFCDAHPDRQVVVYANTSAAVKARADWMVTSSCALADRAAPEGPGARRSSGRPTATWAATSRSRPAPTCCCGTAPASCTTSSRARAGPAARAHPNAMVLVHPESPEAWSSRPTWSARPRSCSRRWSRAAREYIVATDNGLMHRMRQLAPGKTLIEAPTAGNSATCKSCAHCPWMAMNALQGVVDCLEQGQRRDLRARARARPGTGLHRAHARLRQGQPAKRGPAAQRLRAQHRRG
jgi:quinolinate synthase